MVTPSFLSPHRHPTSLLPRETTSTALPLITLTLPPSHVHLLLLASSHIYLPTHHLTYNQTNHHHGHIVQSVRTPTPYDLLMTSISSVLLPPPSGVNGSRDSCSCSGEVGDARSSRAVLGISFMDFFVSLVVWTKDAMTRKVWCGRCEEGSEVRRTWGVCLIWTRMQRGGEVHTENQTQRDRCSWTVSRPFA